MRLEARESEQWVAGIERQLMELQERQRLDNAHKQPRRHEASQSRYTRAPATLSSSLLCATPPAALPLLKCATEGPVRGGLDDDGAPVAASVHDVWQSTDGVQALARPRRRALHKRLSVPGLSAEGLLPGFLASRPGASWTGDEGNALAEALNPKTRGVLQRSSWELPPLQIAFGRGDPRADLPRQLHEEEAAAQVSQYEAAETSSDEGAPRPERALPSDALQLGCLDSAAKSGAPASTDCGDVAPAGLSRRERQRRRRESARLRLESRCGDFDERSDGARRSSGNHFAAPTCGSDGALPPASRCGARPAAEGDAPELPGVQTCEAPLRGAPHSSLEDILVVEGRRELPVPTEQPSPPQRAASDSPPSTAVTRLAADAGVFLHHRPDRVRPERYPSPADEASDCAAPADESFGDRTLEALCAPAHRSPRSVATPVRVHPALHDGDCDVEALRADSARAARAAAACPPPLSTLTSPCAASPSDSTDAQAPPADAAPLSRASSASDMVNMGLSQTVDDLGAALEGALAHANSQCGVPPLPAHVAVFPTLVHGPMTPAHNADSPRTRFGTQSPDLGSAGSPFARADRPQPGSAERCAAAPQSPLAAGSGPRRSLFQGDVLGSPQTEAAESPLRCSHAWSDAPESVRSSVAQEVRAESPEQAAREARLLAPDFIARKRALQVTRERPPLQDLQTVADPTRRLYTETNTGAAAPVEVGSQQETSPRRGSGTDNEQPEGRAEQRAATPEAPPDDRPTAPSPDEAQRSSAPLSGHARQSSSTCSSSSAADSSLLDAARSWSGARASACWNGGRRVDAPSRLPARPKVGRDRYGGSPGAAADGAWTDVVDKVDSLGSQADSNLLVDDTVLMGEDSEVSAPQFPLVPSPAKPATDAAPPLHRLSKVAGVAGDHCDAPPPAPRRHSDAELAASGAAPAPTPAPTGRRRRTTYGGVPGGNSAGGKGSLNGERMAALRESGCASPWPEADGERSATGAMQQAEWLGAAQRSELWRASLATDKQSSQGQPESASSTQDGSSMPGRYSSTSDVRSRAGSDASSLRIQHLKLLKWRLAQLKLPTASQTGGMSLTGSPPRAGPDPCGKVEAPPRLQALRAEQRAPEPSRPAQRAALGVAESRDGRHAEASMRMRPSGSGASDTTTASAHGLPDGAASPPAAASPADGAASGDDGGRGRKRSLGQRVVDILRRLSPIKGKRLAAYKHTLDTSTDEPSTPDDTPRRAELSVQCAAAQAETESGGPSGSEPRADSQVSSSAALPDVAPARHDGPVAAVRLHDCEPAALQQSRACADASAADLGPPSCSAPSRLSNSALQRLKARALGRLHSRLSDTGHDAHEGSALHTLPPCYERPHSVPEAHAAPSQDSHVATTPSKSYDARAYDDAEPVYRSPRNHPRRRQPFVTELSIGTLRLRQAGQRAAAARGRPTKLASPLRRAGTREAPVKLHPVHGHTLHDVAELQAAAEPRPASRAGGQRLKAGRRTDWSEVQSRTASRLETHLIPRNSLRSRGAGDKPGGLPPWRPGGAKAESPERGSALPGRRDATAELITGGGRMHVSSGYGPAAGRRARSPTSGLVPPAHGALDDLIKQVDDLHLIVASHLN